MGKPGSKQLDPGLLTSSAHSGLDHSAVAGVRDTRSLGATGSISAGTLTQNGQLIILDLFGNAPATLTVTVAPSASGQVYNVGSSAASGSAFRAQLILRRTGTNTLDYTFWVTWDDNGSPPSPPASNGSITLTGSGWDGAVTVTASGGTFWMRKVDV